MAKKMIALWIGVLMTAARVSGDVGKQNISHEEVRSRLCSRISVGLSRSQVERELAELPVVVTYCSRDFLQGIGQAVHKGIQLSGQYDVRTEAEVSVWNFFNKRQLFASIFIGDGEKVIGMKIQSFGLAQPADECVDK